MRSRVSLVVAISCLLTLPALASTANPAASLHRHGRHNARATASQCGQVAGHATHTVLAAPAAVPCHTRAATVSTVSASVAPVDNPLSNAPATVAPVAPVRTRAAALSTHPAAIHATIPSVRRACFVAPLRGSLESLMRQNERDEAEGLVRIENDAQLDQLEANREIVPVPASYSLRVNPDLPTNRRYCRPWTARFLADLARSHYARFRRSLQVNSAVRTVEFQRSLMEINGNAAPADGDIASPHLTGAAVDIGKKGMSFSELSWMRAWLLPLADRRQNRRRRGVLPVLLPRHRLPQLLAPCAAAVRSTTHDRPPPPHIDHPARHRRALNQGIYWVKGFADLLN